MIDDLDDSVVATATTEELYKKIVEADKTLSLKEELEADIALLEILPESLESEVLKTETLMEEIKIEVDNGLKERPVQEIFTTAVTDVKGIAAASEGKLPIETENKVLIAEKEIQEKINAAPTQEEEVKVLAEGVSSITEIIKESITTEEGKTVLNQIEEMASNFQYVPTNCSSDFTGGLYTST